MSSADRLQHSYLHHASPYELLLETISLQNKTLTTLTAQLLDLQTQHSLLLPNALPAQLLETRLTRTRQARLCRRAFLEEGLAVKRQLFEAMHQEKKKQRLEEIHLKYEQLKQLRSGRGENVFLNLEEGQLEEVMEWLQGQAREEDQKELAHWLRLHQQSSRLQ